MEKITHLVSMVEFVKQFDYVEEDFENAFLSIMNYANFLSQPLELWMFVPCEEGNVLEDSDVFLGKHLLYETAKQRCLFEGWTLNKDKQPVIVKKPYSDMELPLYFRSDGGTWIYQNDCADKPKDFIILDLLSMDLWYTIKLTETSLNQIY
jgi:hypothetical protein